MTSANSTELLQIHAPALDLLLDIELPVSISFGRARLPLDQVSQLTIGSDIELDRSVGDPVDVLVNQSVVARGEVVVIDGNYGVRIRQIVGRPEQVRNSAALFGPVNPPEQPEH
jgi:flagellar motor switch protein FliN